MTFDAFLLFIALLALASMLIVGFLSLNSRD